MGCDYYHIDESGMIMAHFSEDGNSDCLCTFPHNDQERMSPGRVRAMALLGAAVVLLKQGQLSPTEDGYVFLPDMLPDWVVDGINRLVPEDLEDG